MSNYITKDLAIFVANKMIEKISVKIKNKNSELSELIIAAYNKTLPREIIELSSKFPNYFKKCGRVLLKDNGLNDGFLLTKSVVSTTDNYQVAFQPDPSTAKLVSKSLNELKKLENKRDELKSQIKNTLLNLKTYKRIQEQFPEAFELLPDRKVAENTLAIPIDDIRKQLVAIK